jgi:hypothetical protein
MPIPPKGLVYSIVNPFAQSYSMMKINLIGEVDAFKKYFIVLDSCFNSDSLHISR